MANSWLQSVWSHPVGARLAFYPTLLFGILKTNAQRKWFNRVDDTVLLGALPLWKVAKELITKENVKGVVTLNEAYETRFLCPDVNAWQELGARVCHIPTVDYNNAPSLEQVETGLNFIKSFEGSGCVYVHCKAGRSRSATVVVCYVMKKYGLPPSEAIAFVQGKRPHIVLASAHRERIEEFHATSN